LVCRNTFNGTGYLRSTVLELELVGLVVRWHLSPAVDGVVSATNNDFHMVEPIYTTDL